jgi:chromosome partitioning protein
MPVIAVIHQKGGVGKSTIACNLGVEFGNILDLDSQQSSVLFNRLRKRSNLPELNCYTANSTDDIKKIISKYQNSDKVLICDCGGFDNTWNRTVMLLANLIITPLAATSQFDIFGLQNFTKTLIEASQATGKEIITNVLVNNINVQNKGSISELQEFVKTKNNLRIFNTILHSRSDFKNSIGFGMSVIEYNSKNKAAEEMKSLIKEIKINL